MLKTATKKPEPAFEVHFIGPGLHPDSIPFRAVSETLSAIQDIAAARDPYETPSVPLEQTIALVRVRKGSAVYACGARAPDSARRNLKRFGDVLQNRSQRKADLDALAAGMRPLKALSDIARQFECRVEVRMDRRKETELLTITEDDYGRSSKNMFMKGETSVIGRVERAGGATGMRCLLRIPDRRKILYCDVKNRDLVRKLGENLYETIVATGEATWIQRSWRLHDFTITGFTKPEINDASDLIRELRAAGLDAWDQIDDPASFVAESRK